MTETDCTLKITAIPASPSGAYLAGPMRGRPHFNFPAFREAREKLRAAGYQVHCPAERDERDGFVPDPAGLDLTGWNARKSLDWDARHVLSAELVAVLPGWESSVGCGWEITAANMAGIPVYRVEELLAAHEEGRSPVSLRFSGDPAYLRILREMIWLHQRKGADYGKPGDPFANVRASAEWGVAPWIGALVRANDKVVRLQAAARGSALQNEGIEDSLIDLACYSIISLCLFRQEGSAKVEAVA